MTHPSRAFAGLDHMYTSLNQIAEKMYQKNVWTVAVLIKCRNVWNRDADPRFPTCMVATRRMKIEKLQMKKSMVLRPAGPSRNHDHKSVNPIFISEASGIEIRTSYRNSFRSSKRHRPSRLSAITPRRVRIECEKPTSRSVYMVGLPVWQYCWTWSQSSSTYLLWHGHPLSSQARR